MKVILIPRFTIFNSKIEFYLIENFYFSMSYINKEMPKISTVISVVQILIELMNIYKVEHKNHKLSSSPKR